MNTSEFLGGLTESMIDYPYKKLEEMKNDIANNACAFVFGLGVGVRASQNSGLKDLLIADLYAAGVVLTSGLIYQLITGKPYDTSYFSSYLGGSHIGLLAGDIVGLIIGAVYHPAGILPTLGTA